MSDIERRFIPASELRVAKPDDDTPTTIDGYAAVFNKLSEDLGGFREKIAPGAFARSIKDGDDIRALVDHDSSRLLGRTKANTLTISEDKTGLRAAITPPDTQVGRDIITSIERGDVDGMSFGFITRSDSWQMVEEEEIRTLEDVKLLDVSPVTFPAYPDTSVAVRSLDAFRKDNAPKPTDTSVQKAKLRLAETQ